MQTVLEIWFFRSLHPPLWERTLYWQFWQGHSARRLHVICICWSSLFRAAPDNPESSQDISSRLHFSWWGEGQGYRLGEAQGRYIYKTESGAEHELGSDVWRKQESAGLEVKSWPPWLCPLTVELWAGFFWALNYLRSTDMSQRDIVTPGTQAIHHPTIPSTPDGGKPLWKLFLNLVSGYFGFQKPKLLVCFKACLFVFTPPCFKKD